MDVTAVERKFVDLGGVRPSDSNLTELNATDSVDGGFMSHNDWLAHVTRYGYIMKLVERDHSPSILDVGCGKMSMIKFFYKNRSAWRGRYFGLDARATPDWLTEVQFKGDVVLMRGDVTQPYGLKQFDAAGPFKTVVCTEVLEHVPVGSRSQLMNNLYDWTAANGTMILSSPNAGVSASTADNHKDEDGVSREMTYADKLELAQGAGFIPIASYGTFIQKRNIPAEAMTREMWRVEEYLPYAWFSVFMAAPYPELANNSLMVFAKEAS